jgi:hypothetical protein
MAGTTKGQFKKFILFQGFIQSLVWKKAATIKERFLYNRPVFSMSHNIYYVKILSLVISR